MPVVYLKCIKKNGRSRNSKADRLTTKTLNGSHQEDGANMGESTWVEISADVSNHGFQETTAGVLRIGREKATASFR